jgi:hypothetical protein
MPFPRNREHELNGLICFGEVGPWRVNRLAEKNSWVSSPYVTTEVNAVRNDCSTVLLSRDQVYAWDVEGDIYEPFKYMYGYSGMPPDLKPSMVTGDKTAIFAIHLSRRVNVKSLKFSTFHKTKPEGAGWLRVRYGDEVKKDLREVLYLSEENNQTIANNYQFDENIGQGNLLLIEIGPHTQVPYMAFEVLVSNNTIAFHHKIPNTPVKGMAHMMGMARLFSPIDYLPPHMFLNNFHRSQVNVDVSRTVFPLGIRVAPAFVEGDKIPVMLDSQFKGARLPGQYYFSYGNFYNWPESTKRSIDSAYMIVYEYIARWGCRKFDLRARKVDVTTPIIMPDGFPMTNQKRSGLNKMDGFIMEDYFPLDDPFEAAETCSKLFGKLKKTFNITNFGILLNMDRDYAFFFIQHMRTVYGDLFFDFIVISVKNEKDWENLPLMISFLATYAEQKRITVRVDYNMPFNEYPAAIMLCSLWGVEGFIWASYVPHLMSKGMNIEFDGLLTWWEECGNSTLTKLFVTHDFVDAILIDYNTGERTQWLCRPIGFGNQKLYYNEKEVIFPVGCKTRTSEDRRHKILKRGDKKKRLKMV